MTHEQILSALKTQYDDARIVDGEIHAYGTMQNTNETGWFLYGYVGDPHAIALLDDLQRGQK